MRSSARRSSQVASKRSKVSEHPLIGPAPWSPGPSVIQGLCWRKWSFPFGSLGPDGAGLPGWTVVHKRRRMSRFRLVGRQLMAEVAERAAGPECGVELTEVRSGGETWWSLGFEATGPADLLRSTLEAAAALMFAQAPPGDAELNMGHCQSYAEWLSRRPVPRVGKTAALRLDVPA